MTANRTPKRGFLHWIALARVAIAQNKAPRQVSAFGPIPDHLLDDLGIAPVEFDHSGQLYRRQ